MFESLREINGIGEKVSTLLIDHFGSEKAALKSLNNQEYHELLLVGIPFQKAVVISRNVYSENNSFEYNDLLKTMEAKEIFKSVSTLLLENACTDYGRLKLSLFYPTNNEIEIKRRLHMVDNAKNLVSSLSIEIFNKVKQRRSELKPFYKINKIQVTNSILVTEDKEQYDKLQRDYSKSIEILLLESQSDLEFLKDYPLVRYIKSPKSDLLYLVESLPRVIMVDSIQEKDILPELVLSYFVDNIQSIKACKDILEMIGDERVKVLKDLRNIINTIDSISGPNKVTKNFSYAFQNFRQVIEKIVDEANEDLERRINEVEYLIEGKDVLNILASFKDGDFKSSLPQEISSIIVDVSREWECECARRLMMEGDALVFAGIFSKSDLYPMAIEEDTLIRIESFLEEEAGKEEFREKQIASALLDKYTNFLSETILHVFELDFLLALGEFTIKYDGHPAKITKDLCIAFKGAKHIFLRGKEIKGEINPQPIDYIIGKSRFDFNGSKGERITVLTGANSGGKTTLLETIAQIQIMAQSGLPILTDKGEISILDEIYYYGRRPSNNSAGAFEALLTSLAKIYKRNGRRLILADEIEAITEPGAAAKILSVLLELFRKEKNCIAGVVTHLGSDINCPSSDVRIDGIEAKGIGKDLNLIVNRNPVLNKIARSTPELIVERLEKSDKKRAEFYNIILKKFK
jgi:hypothetical protein